LFCAFANCCTCSTVVAGYKFSVLYSRLPAQFVSFESGNLASNGETMGPATRVERNLMKFLLSMVEGLTCVDGSSGLAITATILHFFWLMDRAANPAADWHAIEMNQTQRSVRPN